MREALGILVAVLVLGLLVWRMLAGRVSTARRRIRASHERICRDGMICSRCGYNMRANPRQCSECGYRPS